MIEFLFDFNVYNTIKILFESVEFFLIIKVFVAIRNNVIFYIFIKYKAYALRLRK